MESNSGELGRLLAGAGLAAIMSAGLATCRNDPDPVFTTRADARISVIPFQSDPGIDGQVTEAFAESLAARLKVIAGFDARVADGPPANGEHFLLEGEVTTESERTVVAVRVRPVSTGAAVWTATFWRRDLQDTALISDLARAVADGFPMKPATTSRRPQSPEERP